MTIASHLLIPQFLLCRRLKAHLKSKTVFLECCWFQIILNQEFETILTGSYFSSFDATTSSAISNTSAPNPFQEKRENKLMWDEFIPKYAPLNQTWLMCWKASIWLLWNRNETIDSLTFAFHCNCDVNFYFHFTVKCKQTTKQKVRGYYFTVY